MFKRFTNIMYWIRHPYQFFFEEQLPPLSEEEETEHDAAWMRQMERMCCDD